MRRIVCVIIVMTGLFVSRASAQSAEVQQLILNIEKLAQFKQILSDMKKGYEILNGGYNTIKDISQGNFSIHKTFLDGLMAVSPTVKKYKRVADIINMQKSILTEYKSALRQFKAGGLFNSGELDYMTGVYNNLVQKSIDNLTDLTMVVTAGELRMSDDERIEAIDRIYADVEDKLVFLRNFNSNTSVLAGQRAKERNDVQSMQSIYDLKK